MFEYLQEKKRSLPHRLLLYGLHLNDLIAFSTSYVACGVDRQDMWAREKSQLVDFIFKRIEKEISRKKKIRELTSPSNFEKPYFVRNINAIRQMKTEAHRQGADFLVAILPVLVDVQKGTFSLVYDEIKRLFNKYDIAYIDLTSSVESYRDADLWILPFDQHPNEMANDLFARSLEKPIKNIFVRGNKRPRLTEILPSADK